MSRRIARSRPFGQRCLGLCFFLWIGLASSRATTNYTISLENPELHLMRVQILLPEGPALRELQLPVWNALYQIRDFAQNLNWVTREKPRRTAAFRVHTEQEPMADYGSTGWRHR